MAPTVSKWRGMAQKMNTLHWALVVSIGIHAVVLSIRFVSPKTYDKLFRDTPLEVILVNAKSQEVPDKAQAIAQANLAGGGDSQKGRASSPLPPSLKAVDGTEVVDQEEQRMQAMKQQQALMLTQLRQKLNLANQELAKAPSTEPQTQQERERKLQQLLNMLAEIEKRVQEENARPRKRYISPATREAAYAAYYDRLRHQIEAHGTTHFPQVNGQKLYGSLTMSILINHDGSVLSTRIEQSSANPTLDRQAQSIVSALQFGAFTAAMLNKADQIEVVSRFRFTRDETLATTISEH
jgi:periplasmic protein TonB